MSTVNSLGDVLWVPNNVVTKIKSKYPEEETKRQEMVKYYINTHPDASWAHIAGGLLYTGHTTLSAELKNKIKEENGKCSFSEFLGAYAHCEELSPNNMCYVRASCSCSCVHVRSLVIFL